MTLKQNPKKNPSHKRHTIRNTKWKTWWSMKVSWWTVIGRAYFEFSSARPRHQDVRFCICGNVNAQRSDDLECWVWKIILEWTVIVMISGVHGVRMMSDACVLRELRNPEIRETEFQKCWFADVQKNAHELGGSASEEEVCICVHDLKLIQRMLSKYASAKTHRLVEMHLWDCEI